MIAGKVKWFNAGLGYGFIERLDGGEDVFVHIAAVKRAGLATLTGGEPIEFEEVRSSTGIRADNLRT